MGFIDFTNGEVLTADQMDLVMRQGIMRFADASARDTALSEVLAEGMMAYLDDTDEVLKYDGTDWIDISGDITGVTAGTALTGGGTSGNVTLDVDEAALTIAQSQVTDLVSDITDKQDDVITTQGDLVIGDASGDPVRLPVGSADQVLTSDGTTVSFQDAGGGGGGLFFGNLPPLEFSVFNVDFPANTTVRFASISSTNISFLVSLYDSSDELVTQITVERDTPFLYFTNATAIAKIAVNNDFTSETPVLIFSQPTAANDANISKEIITITSTQSVTIASSFDAFIFGAGGSGGGTDTADLDAGGGGSGFFATTTLSAGTYTATIGAGGDEVRFLNGLDGGSSEINSVTALGGSGGNSGMIAGNGNGGAGGSGGGAGVGGAGGQNGGNGEDRSGNTGGIGSGVTLPDASLFEKAELVPGSRATAAKNGGLYEGGGGSENINGESRSAFNGGGGGVNNNRFSGEGGNGVIILVEV